MPNRGTSIVLSRPSPCDVPQGYASVGGLPAALLDDPVGYLVENFRDLKPGFWRSTLGWTAENLGPFEHPVFDSVE